MPDTQALTEPSPEWLNLMAGLIRSGSFIAREEREKIAAALSRLAQVEPEIAELKSCLASWQKSAGPNSERVGQQEREITRLNNELSAMTERWRAAELECANVVVRLSQVERERTASDAVVAWDADMANSQRIIPHDINNWRRQAIGRQRSRQQRGTT
jgi:chromosome segregation ATPase